jgi:hypothetical protein
MQALIEFVALTVGMQGNVAPKTASVDPSPSGHTIPEYAQSMYEL